MRGGVEEFNRNNLVNTFKSTAQVVGTPWLDEQTNYIIDSLIISLESMREEMFEDDFNIIKASLPLYVNKMALSVISDIAPPSTFIDAFLLGFVDRINIINSSNRSLHQDSAFQLTIHSQLLDCIETFFNNIKNHNVLDIDVIDNIKADLTQRVHKISKDPFKSEFKSPKSPDELNVIKSNLVNKVQCSSWLAIERHGLWMYYRNKDELKQYF